MRAKRFPDSAGAGLLAGCAASAVPSGPPAPVRPVQQNFSAAGLDQAGKGEAALAGFEPRETA